MHLTLCNTVLVTFPFTGDPTSLRIPSHCSSAFKMPSPDDASVLRILHTTSHATVAIILSYFGTYIALSLARATLYVQSRWFRFMAGLSFVLQSVFALHFVDMLGMNFGLRWGMDPFMTLGSFLLISVFGTGAIYIAISARERLESQLQQHFPGFPHDPKTRTLASQARYGTSSQGSGVYGIRDSLSSSSLFWCFVRASCPTEPVLVGACDPAGPLLPTVVYAQE